MISSQLISHSSQPIALSQSTFLLALSKKYFLLSTIFCFTLKNHRLVFGKRPVRFLEKACSFFRKGLLDFQKTQRPFLAIEPPFFQPNLSHENQSCLVKLSELSSRKITDLRCKKCSCPIRQVHTSSKKILHMQ